MSNPYVKTAWVNDSTPAISAQNLNKMEQGIYDSDALARSVDTSVGEWYFTDYINNVRYPRLQIATSGSAEKIYFKLLEPLTANSITVNGSNDNWQTQTQIHWTQDKEFIVDIPSGYSSIRFALNFGGEYYTGNYSALIHTIDNYSLSQMVLNDMSDIKDLSDELVLSAFVPKEVMTGTKYSGYYLNTAPYKGIRSISNSDFYLVLYEVEKDKAYYLIGKSVAIQAALPIACFGTAAIADKNNYIEKILDGSSTAQDYMQKYIPNQDGYIYIASYEGKSELKLYDSEPISDAYIKGENIHDKLNISIQLFGDSITDNQWGDESTWANYITENLRDYNVTVYNEAVGGAGIGHGKSTTTASHQTEEYNYVYDLVTNGTTLRDVDYIVILVGTNNWTSSFPLGDMSSTGYNTICGSLKGILEYISQNTSATVFVCTIPQRYNYADEEKEVNAYGEPLNSSGETLAEYCEPFRKISAFYGMSCIDLNTSLGWNRTNISEFCGDGLHPNTHGDKMLSAYICSKIKEHIGNVSYS